MTENKLKIQRLTLAAFFAAIEVIMGFTPIGYIPIGSLSITTMHLPVILASILAGPVFGAGIGFIFGMTSFLRATFEPGITSFVFTPFVSIGTARGNIWSLAICFIPRILLGILPAVLYRKMVYLFPKRRTAAALSAVLSTIVHTILVLGGIYLFFGSSYAAVMGTNMKGLAALLLGVASTNMIFEAVLAGAAIPALAQALRPAAERMGILHVES